MRLFLLLLFVCGIFACTSETSGPADYTQLQGKTMGTTYSVKYLDSLERNFQSTIDSLLLKINAEVSTYEQESVISRFNRSEEPFRYLNLLNGGKDIPQHFKTNFDKSKEVYENSQGYYDPTIMPIVNYWGFGYTEKRPVQEVDKLKVDSLMDFVGFEKIKQRSEQDGWIFLEKTKPGVQLDFSAIAKGYAVDVVAELLEGSGVQHYFVEIGGELRVKGKNPADNLWTIGINTPSETASLGDLQSKVMLDNQAVATSGNYRNYYEVNGVKYAHTINTKTGFPEKNKLLSATIFAADCMTADAYATACMAMGLERAMDMIHLIEGVDAYFLVSDDDGGIISISTAEDLKILTD